MNERIVIIGWPRAGKSTLAATLSLKHLCTDPQSVCPKGVQGVPDDLSWSEASRFVADSWLGRPGTVIEGVGAARALRKWIKANPGRKPPVDKVIVLKTQYGRPTNEQTIMGRGVDTVLKEITPMIQDIIEVRGGEVR